MNTVGDRIKTARKRIKLSQPELARSAGVAQSTISDLENNKKSPSVEIMKNIADSLKTTIDYLLTGREDAQSNASVLSNIERNEDFVQIKYYDSIPVSCGFGSFGEILERDAKELTIAAEPLKQRSIRQKDCIALPATGDSMYPTIKDKDTVYVDLSRSSIKDGKIFAICHGGLFKFKRLYQLPLGGVRVASDNYSEYPEERLNAQDIIDQQFEVIGWAWSWQSMENW